MLLSFFDSFLDSEESGMAMKAVGWLSQNLGWNISGRGSGPQSPAQQTEPTEAEACFGSLARPQSGVDTYLSKISSVVFGPDGTSAPQAAGSSATASSAANNNDDIDNAELDEQGLPKSRNWYYYDESLGRWNVAPDAPQKIKDEYAARLKMEEEEKLRANRIPEPPPPPPPTFNAAAFTAQRSPLVPQYAVPTYFGKED